MSPTAEPASAPGAAEASVPERLLGDGEVVILSIKPGAFFVLLASLPVLASAAVVLAGTLVLTEVLGFDLAVPPHVVVLFCAAAGLGRVGIAGFQWAGRLYVLTNLRVIRLAGVIRADVNECPLKRIFRVELSSGPGERLAGLGTLAFATAQDGAGAAIEWSCVARPEEVLEIVNETVRRSR